MAVAAKGSYILRPVVAVIPVFMMGFELDRVFGQEGAALTPIPDEMS